MVFREIMLKAWSGPDSIFRSGPKGVLENYHNT